MSGRLFIRNEQRLLPLNARSLAQLTRSVLEESLMIGDFDLGIYLVRSPKMARLNETFLGHTGPTDVITFNYADPPSPVAKKIQHIHGEIFICVDEARTQAQRFRTTWQSELVRYIIHGILHLQGYDDLALSARRAMKRAENGCLKEIASRFPLRKLGADSKIVA